MMKTLWIFCLGMMASTSVWAQAPVQEPAQDVNVCQGFQLVEFNVDGQPMMRYKVSSEKLRRCLPAQPETNWTVTKTYWSDSDERNWQNFVHSIGMALEQGRCSSIDTCLVSSANVYRDQTDFQASYFSDCADLPMYLRAYFAYKNHLPFTFGTGIRANRATSQQLSSIQLQVDRAQAYYSEALNQGLPAEELQKRLDALTTLQQKQQDLLSPKDLRYTRNGNYFTSRITVPSSNGAGRSFFGIARQINDQYSSGSLRMLLTAAGQIQADFYPPGVNKKSIIIGTVAYKVTGHVSMVYDITASGEVKLLESHPENIMSVSTYSNEYLQSLPTHGAGLKNWRPIRIDNPIVKSGIITAGQTTLIPNEQIPTFSLEQYFGNADMNNANSKEAKWIVRGQSVDFFDYVRIKMADDNYKMDPLFQFKSDMNALCRSVKARANSVEVSVGAGMGLKSHPENLPKNIYGAADDWESYATPGSDLRIRSKVLALINNAKTYLAKLASRDQFFSYQGNNLKRDLIKIYNEVASSCIVTYKNSKRQDVKLGLGVALKRVTKMSFDPYLCPERLAGASSRTELATCADDSEKSEWYGLEQFLRNATERDSNQVMGWSLEDLRNLNRTRAVDNSDHSADYDISKKLSEL